MYISYHNPNMILTSAASCAKLGSCATRALKTSPISSEGHTQNPSRLFCIIAYRFNLQPVRNHLYLTLTVQRHVPGLAQRVRRYMRLCSVISCYQASSTRIIQPANCVIAHLVFVA